MENKLKFIIAFCQESKLDKISVDQTGEMYIYEENGKAESNLRSFGEEKKNYAPN